MFAHLKHLIMASIKYYLIVAIALFFHYGAVAQDKKAAGIIYYNQTTSMKGAKISISGGGSDGSTPSIPDKVTSENELIFNTTGAKYQKTYNANAGGISIGGMVISSGGSNRKVFFDFAQNKVNELVTLPGEEYLMETKLGALSDTVTKTDETKTIIGFNCKKAIIKNKGTETTIWYTTDLKFNASPQPGFWTEGVVLALQNDRISYQATSVEYYKVKDSEIAAPKDVKPITADEYKVKQAELMKKIQSGGGGAIRFGN
jgi:GLPGLI family protein